MTFAGLFSYTIKSTVKFSNSVVIVGPNNAGKSNLFRIIRILADTLYQNRTLTSEISQSADNSHIEAEILLSEDERYMLADFFACGHTGKDNAETQVIYMSNRKKIASYLDNIIIKMEWMRASDGSSNNPNTEILFPKCGFVCKGSLNEQIFNVMRLDGRSSTHQSAELIQFNKFITRIFHDDDPKAGSASFFDSSSAIFWPASFNSANIDKMNAKFRSKIQELMRQLKIQSGATVSLPHVLGIILTNSIVHATENRNLLQNKIEKKFEELVILEPDPDGFKSRYNRTVADKLISMSMEHADTLEHDGSNIAQFLFSLKNSSKRSHIASYSTIKKEFGNLFGKMLSIEPVWENNVLQLGEGGVQLSSPNLVVVDEGLSEHLPLDQVGAGVRNVIYLLAAVHGTTNSIVMLDEPGINLHPAMLQAVMKGIDVQKSNNQIFIVTHSPDLLRYEIIRKDANIICVRNADGQSKICQVETSPSQKKRDPRGIGHQIEPEVFFAKRVVLVEGKSDLSLLNDLTKDMAIKDSKYDLPLNNVAVVSVGGKMAFPRYRKLLDQCEIPWIILSDEDSLKDTFKEGEVSRISKDEIKDKEPVYILTGDLEAFMMDLDRDTFDEVKDKSKVSTALKFIQKMREKNSEWIPDPIVKFLDRCVE